MRIFALQWSLHGVYATARAQRYCVSPAQMNMGHRPKRMSCPPRRFVEDSSVRSAKKRWRKWNENAKQTAISMMLGLLNWIRRETANNSFRGIQSRIRSMSGVITMIKGITFPSFAWKKCFSPRKVRWRIEDTFFTGHCIVASRQSCGPAEKMTPRCA